MKKEINNNIAKIDVKIVNGAGKKARQEVANAGKVLKMERNSLSATIALIAKSNNPESEVLRVALGLQKNANKKARQEAEAVVLANIRYAVTCIYVTSVGEGDEVMVNKCILPSTSTGKIRSDYLTVITEAIATKNALFAKKREIAQLARVAKSEGKILAIDKLPKSLQEVFSAKYHTQIVGEKIFRN